MRWRNFFLCWSFFLGHWAFSQTTLNLPASFAPAILEELKPFYSPSEGQTEDLLKGTVISVSKVEHPSDTEQQMMLFVAGVHSRNCQRAMRKLSLYENYHQFIDFIKDSKYDEKSQIFSYTIDHSLLPFPMVMTFKIPRITKAGHYPFILDHGFLKGLHSTVIVKDVGKFCLLGLKSQWRGPRTKIPNLAFELFAQTVGKLGLEHLIRVSQF